MNFIARLVCFFVGISLSFSVFANNDKTISENDIHKKLATLESENKGRLGVSAIDSNTQQKIQYRSNEFFLTASTFKVMVVSAVLKKSMTDKALLDKKIYYKQSDIRTWSPETEKHIADGMTVKELCAAAIKYSDNTAAVLLMNELGGIDAINEFAHSIDDKDFKIVKTAPDDFTITSTPEAMEKSLQQLTLNNILAPAQQDLLIQWMKENTTGDLRIRAGVPKGWTVADKTGSGSEYGLTNDIAVIYPPNCKPIVVTLYFIQNNKNATGAPAVLASATRLLIEDFAKTDQCIAKANKL